VSGSFDCGAHDVSASAQDDGLWVGWGRTDNGNDKYNGWVSAGEFCTFHPAQNERRMGHPIGVVGLAEKQATTITTTSTTARSCQGKGIHSHLRRDKTAPKMRHPAKVRGDAGCVSPLVFG